MQRKNVNMNKKLYRSASCKKKLINIDYEYLFYMSIILENKQRENKQFNISNSLLVTYIKQ